MSEASVLTRCPLSATEIRRMLELWYSTGSVYTDEEYAEVSALEERFYTTPTGEQDPVAELSLLADALEEIARLREGIEKLGAAIRWLYGYDEPGTPPFPVELNSRYGWRRVGRELPGVRAALGEVERGNE